MKVWIGSCIWREVEVAHMASLFPLLRSPLFSYHPQVGDALVNRARCINATQFLENKEYDVHLSIDSDITGFSYEDTVRLCEMADDYDIVGGVYVCRATKTWPASFYLDGDVVTHAFDHTPVEVKYLATGFLAVHRRVFEALAEVTPIAAPSDPKRYYTFYMPYLREEEDLKETIELSEDWAFCQRAKDLGFRCYIDPAIRLGHIGTYVYTLEDMLREQIEPHPMAVWREGLHWTAKSLSSPEEAVELKAHALTRA